MSPAFCVVSAFRSTFSLSSFPICAACLASAGLLPRPWPETANSLFCAAALSATPQITSTKNHIRKTGAQNIILNNDLKHYGTQHKSSKNFLEQVTLAYGLRQTSCRASSSSWPSLGPRSSAPIWASASRPATITPPTSTTCSKSSKPTRRPSSPPPRRPHRPAITSLVLKAVRRLRPLLRRPLRRRHASRNATKNSSSMASDGSLSKAASTRILLRHFKIRTRRDLGRASQVSRLISRKLLKKSFIELFAKVAALISGK